MGVRSYHVYRSPWEPVVGEVLQFYQEPDNKHDQFAVALKSSAGVGNESSVVGHAPIEISRILYFALQHGCQLCAIVAESKYYPSPLVQEYREDWRSKSK